MIVTLDGGFLSNAFLTDAIGIFFLAIRAESSG
jgi:hypothetical protein